MNIYIHVEIAARELDSKLLLAVIAASKGHDAFVSDLGTIIRGARTGFFSPGLFHTKSLTPGLKKIALHQELIDRGFKISSIDEEAALIYRGYDNFAAIRYSEKTLQQASAVFGWGTDDTETLARVYPAFRSSFHKTGSPRADLWMWRFNGYWQKPEKSPERPYLLVASNMQGANSIRPFHEKLKFERRTGYYHRDPDRFARQFYGISEDYCRTLAFVEAIRYLAESNGQYDIVLRPHPIENTEAWKVYLEGIPNVHVIKEGSITAWVNNAFAIMHNGCTTAIEATIAGKPVVTYLPFEQKYDREIPNELGKRVASLTELSDTVNDLFLASRSDAGKDEKAALPPSVAKKIHLDDRELAAERFVTVWESLDNGALSGPCNWWKFQVYIKLATLRGIAISTLQNASPDKFGSPIEGYKFPPIEGADIDDRIRKLRNILGIKKELTCKVLTKRAILIRPQRSSDSH